MRRQDLLLAIWHMTCFNKLAVIAGNCDQIEATKSPNFECCEGLHRIRSLAILMAEMLQHRQCGIDVRGRLLALGEKS